MTETAKFLCYFYNLGTVLSSSSSSTSCCVQVKDAPFLKETFMLEVELSVIAVCIIKFFISRIIFFCLKSCLSKIIMSVREKITTRSAAKKQTDSELMDVIVVDMPNQDPPVIKIEDEGDKSEDNEETTHVTPKVTPAKAGKKKTRGKIFSRRRLGYTSRKPVPLEVACEIQRQMKSTVRHNLK